MRRLTDKIALITGGASGIGLATARAFIREGAQVLITGRDLNALEAAVADLGASAQGLVGDQASLDDSRILAAEVARRYGRVDIAFLNAGAGGPASVETATEEHFDRVFDTNVKGVFFLVQALAPLMPQGGSIVLNTSISPYGGAAGTALYSGAKSAVRTFARAFSADLLERGVRVNAIAPGPIDTPIFARYRPDADELASHIERLKAFVPLARLGRPEEVAEAVLFLASDDSRFMLGAELIFDGGASEAPHASPMFRRL